MSYLNIRSHAQILLRIRDLDAVLFEFVPYENEYFAGDAGDTIFRIINPKPQFEID